MADRDAIRRWALGPGGTVALTGLLAAFSVAEVLQRSDTPHTPAATAFAAAGALPLLAWRNRPLLAVTALAVLVLASTSFLDVSPPSALVLVVALVCYQSGALRPARVGLPAVAALVVAIQIATGFEYAPNFEILFFTAGPWWLGREVGRRRALVGRLEQRTAELEREEEAFARLSVRRERARIARELHDIVSHHLAVVVVQAGAGRVAAAPTAARTRERLTTIRDAALQALGDMARLVAMLGAAPREAAERLAPLLERTRRAAPEVRVAGLPPAARLPPDVEAVACRVVQEGLTNAMKHAAGAPIDLRLALEDDLVIEVLNGPGAGTAGDLAASGSGLGLAGMDERVRALGGSLRAGPEDGGWRLTARLPVA